MGWRGGVNPNHTHTPLGRFEVHIRVPRPDAAGRAEILAIHLRRMCERGRLEGVRDEAALQRLTLGLAEASDGLSGAELAGVVRAAASRALERYAVVGWRDGKGKDAVVVPCLVTEEDLFRAVREDRNAGVEAGEGV